MIIDYSKNEANKLQMETIETDVYDFVHEVTELMSGAAHIKGLELECFIDENVPIKVQMDPTRTRQILLNLIGNVSLLLMSCSQIQAIKFTERGHVILKVSVDEITSSDLIKLSFSVIDTGIGIEPEMHATIFNM
jgi:signal transduction histidine kinase